MSYFHTGGLDRPLVITKDGQSIIPHQNWRGQFARGTYPNGTRSDCTSYPASGCTPIQWPGERTSARHELEPDGRIQNWFGGLVDGMRDASGQMYMRNRYYDPKTGQFTQTDPIGLAGGFNAYGFANGDPVSYSDPYGLAPDTIVPVGDEARSALVGLYLLAQFASESDDPKVAAAGSALLGGLTELHAHPKKVFFTVDPSMRSVTGPLLDGSGNYRANVNPNQSTKRHITVRAAHELGHAYGALINGATDPQNSAHRRMQNRNSLYFENNARTYFGCAPRLIHGTDSNAQNPRVPAVTALLSPWWQ